MREGAFRDSYFIYVPKVQRECFAQDHAQDHARARARHVRADQRSHSHASLPFPLACGFLVTRTTAGIALSERTLPPYTLLHTASASDRMRPLWLRHSEADLSQQAHKRHCPTEACSPPFLRTCIRRTRSRRGSAATRRRRVLAGPQRITGAAGAGIRRGAPGRRRGASARGASTGQRCH